MKIKPNEIRALRERHHLTQRGLADSLYGVKRERITDWETGRRDCPDLVAWAMILTWDGLNIMSQEDLNKWKQYAL